MPEPFGARDVLGFAEPDSGWLGPVVDGRTVSPYICLAERSTDRLMRGLNRVGLIAKLPRAALGSGSRHGSAVDASREPVAHRVAVLRRGRCLDAGLIRGNGDFRMAAASSVVFADAVVGRDGGRAGEAWGLVPRGGDEPPPHRTCVARGGDHCERQQLRGLLSLGMRAPTFSAGPRNCPVCLFGFRW